MSRGRPNDTSRTDTSRTDTPDADAARAGADIEVTAQDPPDDLPGSRLDQQTLNAAREALPGWHIQPEQLVRTITAPAGVRTRSAARRSGAGRP